MLSRLLSGSSSLPGRGGGLLVVVVVVVVVSDREWADFREAKSLALMGEVEERDVLRLLGGRGGLMCLKL